MPKKSAFTLIELLIVVAIIGVLSVVGLIAYGNFLKNSRDAKRQSDLKIIQSALEDYHADLLFYPTAAGLVLSQAVSFDSDIGRGSGTAPSTKKTYLNVVPKDPTSSTTTPYCYTTTPANCDNSASNRCSSYTLYAKLDNPSAGASSYTCGSVTYNFQVTPP